METLLVFLAIAAIQFIAAYTKQKKNAAKKRSASAPPPRDEEIPQESSPVPDPFKEIREALGLPPTETEESEELAEEEILEGKKPAEEKPANIYGELNAPFKSITDRNHNDHRPQITASEPIAAPAPAAIRLIDIAKPEHGILWAAILNEPRYKAKWKPHSLIH